jgi:hypothetical protein
MRMKPPAAPPIMALIGADFGVSEPVSDTAPLRPMYEPNQSAGSQMYFRKGASKKSKKTTGMGCTYPRKHK